MKPTLIRRYRRRSSPAKSDGTFFKKENQQEHNFFGDSMHNTFFQPAAAPAQNIQRKCEKCEEEDKKVQRKCEECEKEDKKVRRMEDKKEEGQVMRTEDNKEEEKIQKKTSGVASAPANKTSNYISSLNGKGQTLPPQANNFFSSKMGYDFTDVKIHTDKEATESAKAINAKAYTIGNNVVFNEGQYNTESGEGKKLMAHELTHVVQQENNISKKSIQRKPDDGHNLTNPRFAGDPVLEDCYDNKRVLMVGSTGGAVKKVQQALMDAGFPLPIYQDDGIFGSETQTAVRDFQHASTILVDGIVGPQTMGSLDSLLVPTPPPPVPCIVDVRAVKPTGVGRLPIWHLFIVYTDSAGTEFYFRAGPNSNTSCPNVNDPIDGDNGAYLPGTVDWDPGAPSVTVQTGLSACGKDSCFTSELSRIEGTCTPWEMLGPNSNTFVSTLLNNCGVPLQKPVMFAPGWGDPNI